MKYGDGEPIPQRCGNKQCYKIIFLPVNPMVTAKVCEERGWAEEVWDMGGHPMYVVVCPEHKGHHE